MFRTALGENTGKFKIEHNDPILSMGSCFADRIGKRLATSKFDIQSNPFGIIFNPISIFKLLTNAAEGRPLNENSFVHRDSVFYNYDFHSTFFSSDKSELKRRLASQLAYVGSIIPQLKYIIVTFGTSVVYRKINDEEVVANCHKVPASNFKKELVDQEEIYQAFTRLYLQLKSINPKLRFILSVSPVRHVKDGLVANGTSKAMLRAACHRLEATYAEDIAYFPGFEIMMDDLRDYRFYEDDMIHPNNTAENYIWEYFKKNFISESTVEFINEWEGIRKSLQHKPFQPSSPSHQKFLKQLIGKISKYEQMVDVAEEIALVKNQMTNRKDDL